MISLKKDIKIKNGKTWGKKTVSRIIERASATNLLLHNDYIKNLFYRYIPLLNLPTPKSEIDIQKLLGNFSSVEIYFAIEGVHGKGVKFFEKLFQRERFT